MESSHYTTIKKTVGKASIKKIEDKKIVRKYNVGDLVEARMWNQDNYYWSTFHPAKIISYNDETNQYRCDLLAFTKKDADNFTEDQLTPLRDSEPYLFYRIGDKVHFLWKNRTVNGDLVDRRCSEIGIWVEGIVRGERNNNDELIVEYYDWTGETDKPLKWVNQRYLRLAISDN
jgi:hypothetical protein